MAGSSTPWRKVHEMFDMTQADFARAIGRDRGKISRALADDEGLINGSDVARILAAAKKFGVKLKQADFVPVAETPRASWWALKT